MNTSVVSPGRAGLILLLTGQMLPLIDTSITNVALDSITHSLQATATELELIVALYGVAFAVCLALGSKLGDNLGRRRLFMTGVAIFGLASLLCGMAGSVEQLLAARIVQGAGAALIMPQILATLHVTLKGTAHAKAISLLAASAASRLSSARWAEAGWYRPILPASAGVTPSLSMCRSASSCWH
jgi:MFS family permease